MKRSYLFVSLLCLCSCGEYLRRENLASELRDLAKVSQSYDTIVSNYNAGVSSETLFKDLLGATSVASSEPGVYLLQKGKRNYLVAADEGASAGDVIACTGKPKNYYINRVAETNIWAVKTGLGGYAFYESKIPPVPGCLYSFPSNNLSYPELAVRRFRAIYPEMLAELEAANFQVVTEDVTPD